VKLLLDEMISWRIAVELRSRGCDVVSVKRDRPELEQRHDPAVLQADADEHRAVVTNNVRDYRVAHERALARGETHFGLIYTYDDTLQRDKASISLWVPSLAELLEEHPAEDALVDRILVLA
jgi:predicted nuclease of predicted toxin-antitoxin system